MVAPRSMLAVAIFAVSWVLWIVAIWSAVGRGFFEDQFALQAMVLGGAVSMVAAAVARMWE
jgi:hypothetical protein